MLHLLDYRILQWTTDPEDGTSTLKQGVNVAILDYTKQINLNHKNGMMAFKWGVGTVYVCCTGFYFISQ